MLLNSEVTREHPLLHRYKMVPFFRWTSEVFPVPIIGNIIANLTVFVSESTLKHFVCFTLFKCSKITYTEIYRLISSFTLAVKFQHPHPK